MEMINDRIWVYREIDDGEVARLACEAGISRLLAKVFISRGIVDAGYVRDFLNPDIARMHDPFLMDGMDAAVGRILQALDRREEILVYGDYDVDGVTGTSILFNFLASHGGRVRYFLPDRMKDGYGLTMAVIEKIKAFGASLLITVDCGITAAEEVRSLQDCGMQVIVTDHHECKGAPPDACAVLNPHKPGCGYPFSDLAGAGVVLKLVQGICIRAGFGEEFAEYMDLAALATIADIVPLVDENRIIASYGLRAMQTTKNHGLSALISVAGFGGKPVTSYGAAFGLAPRINAAGRLGSAARGVRLFTSENRTLAEALARELDEENRRRQDMEDKILEEAFEYVESRLDPKTQKVLVICGEGWHHGVIGIVASKVLERYNRPCIVISVEDGLGKGSGRSIKNFNLFKALEACEDLMDRFGGHELAAGLTIKADKIDELRCRLNAYADSVLTDIDLMPCIRVDALLERQDISIESVKELSKMAPFGESNPNPRFGYLSMRIADITALSGGKHLKFMLTDAELAVEAIGFNMGELAERFAAGDTVDIVFTPEVNTWNGTERLQLNLRDMKPSIYADLDKNIVFSKSNDYNSYIDFNEIGILQNRLVSKAAELVPDRRELEAVYRYIRACGRLKQGRLIFDDLFLTSARISEAYNIRMNFYKLKRSLEIFDELGLIVLQPIGRKAAAVDLAQDTGKVELESSRLFLQLQALKELELF